MLVSLYIIVFLIDGLDYWNGILEWTTGLTLFVLKIIFMTFMVPTRSLNQAGAELSTQTSSDHVSSDQVRY